MKAQNKPLRFAISFVLLFLIFYYFNIFYFSLISPGTHYNTFLTHHLNYIQAFRWLLLFCTAQSLHLLGFGAIFNNYELLVAGHGTIQVTYTCLGLGILSFFTAFVLSYPKPLKSKVVLWVTGTVIIEFLNIIRFMLLALYGNKQINQFIDHHTLFNIIIYIIVSVGLYFWIKQDIIVINKHEKS